MVPFPGTTRHRIARRTDAAVTELLEEVSSLVRNPRIETDAESGAVR